MSNIKRTLQMTSLLFGMIMLFCYIGWHLGYEGFIIVGHIEMPPKVIFGIQFLLFLLNVSLQGGFVLQEYTFKVLKFSLPIVFVDAIRAIWFPWIPQPLTSGVLPMIMYFIVAIHTKKCIFYIDRPNDIPICRGVLPRLFLINIVMLSHQFVVSSITQTPLNYDVSIYTILRLSIDVILVKSVFYFIGGEKYYELERMVFPGRTRNERHCNEICQNESQSKIDVPLDKFEKWVMRSVIGVVQVMQWMFILWICSLDNLFLDALVMTTSFICHGMIISKRQHLKPIILCTLAATAMFYFAARFTISFQYSQFFPIFIGLILAYTVYRVSYQLEMKANEKTKKDLKRIEALEEKITTAWARLDELSQ